MTNLSIVVPVFNSLDTLKITLQSIVNNTHNLYELVIVDDYSAQDTSLFIDSLVLDNSLGCRLTKTRNPRHLWTNASWNVGVSLATGSHIAILNSDITVSKYWDVDLLNELNRYSIACPQEIRNGVKTKLDPLIEKIHPGMIKGACFMFDARYKYDWFFPIPELFKHYCGDNYLADRASKIKGVGFSDTATITHRVSSSGRLIDRKLYNEVCRQDVLNYQSYSGRDMSLVLEQIP